VEWVANFGLRPSLSLTQLTLAGVFERFPSLEIFFAETHIGWLPFWLEAADLWYQRHLPWARELLGFEPLQRLPSEYITEHVYWSVQQEHVGLELRHHLGSDHIMFATDFPHIESEWPHTRQALERYFADIPQPEREQICAGNAMRFFRLGAASSKASVASGSPSPAH
jgi:predicted TIM-barrel fold metal-dependent hydrolase